MLFYGLHSFFGGVTGIHYFHDWAIQLEIPEQCPDTMWFIINNNCPDHIFFEITVFEPSGVYRLAVGIVDLTFSVS
jgi:hypothetical protein